MSKQYKLQIEQQTNSWVDVRNENDELLVFETEDEARSTAEKLFPKEVGLERYAAGPKTVRVLIVDPYADKDEDDWAKA